MNRMRISQAVLALLLVVASVHADEQASGPLVVRNLYVYYLPYINFSPGPARTLPPGQMRLSLVNSYANTFRWDPGWTEDDFIFATDLETYLMSCQIDFGITPRWELSAVFCLLSLHGGIFDPLLQSFHGLFGFGNQNRDLVADNDFLIHVENGNGVWLDVERSRFDFGDITLMAKANLLRSSDSLLSLQAALKIPTGNTDSLLGSGKMDAALFLTAERRLGDFVFYLSGGWIYLGRPDDLAIFEFNNHLVGYSLCCEWIVEPGVSLITQVDGRTSPYSSGLSFLDRHCTNIGTGLSLRFDDSKTIQLSVVEEFFSFASVEVGINLGIVIVAG